MKCLYCNNTCVDNTRYYDESDPQIPLDLSDYDCDSCNTYYHKNHHNIWYKGYVITIYESPHSPYAAKLSDSVGTILWFKDKPNITPQNIKEKLKLYLVFS